MVHGRFVEAIICEAMDEAEIDCDSVDEPLLMNSRDLTYTTLVYGTT